MKSGAVLVAEPGAGKTTRVPLALLDEPWLEGRRILMLEPRRIAARSSARYMAKALGERVGETIGYRVRLDTQISERTRVEVITEGILTRMLQEDASLEGVGLVIFDEFHERHLHADLGLALALESQSVLRDDLRLLVMSATLEAESVAAVMGDVPIIRSKGRSFPVETHYVGRLGDIVGGAAYKSGAKGEFERAVATQVEVALRDHEGDIMVFLPGVGEIRRVEAELRKLGWGLNSGLNSDSVSGSDARLDSDSDLDSVHRKNKQVRIAPLYGQLPQAEQDEAIAPNPAGLRKVVLATSIAETSLTVEGVRVVIDSGLMRVPKFSPRTGMTRLETVAVSQASADQRRGRAGRLGPGVCYRLWTEQEHGYLKKQSVPEMLEADLAPLALELAAWGADESTLQWMTPPPAPALAQARELLTQLGVFAAGGNNVLTPHGRKLAEVGVHPRLAHMIVRAIPLGLGVLACDLAALLSERDIVRRGAASGRASDSRGNTALFDPDMRSRVDLLKHASKSESVDIGAVKRVQEEAAQWRRVFAMRLDQRSGSHTEHKVDSHAVGLLLGFAYPDRIAERRTDGRYLLSNGRGAAFLSAANRAIGAAGAGAGAGAGVGAAGLAGVTGSLMQAPYLVCAELDDVGADSRIMLAAPVTRELLEQHFADSILREEHIAWERTTQSVRVRQREQLGALTLKDTQHPAPDAEAVLQALLQGIAQEGLTLLPWTKHARQLQARLQFMHRHLPEDWPDATEEALIASLDEWLGPHVYGMRSRADVQKLNVAAALESLLTWEARQQLDAEAPTHIVVPSGSRIAVDYSNPDQPVLAVRLQELFGLQDTPRIAKGKVALTLHLLSPAQRPVQVTQDLKSFWDNTYFEVKKDLKGRYPKHYWPDNPYEALATRRARPHQSN
ncbi:ATP-dependent RNA helicase [Paenibacillus sp. 481]|uniref:ATP-dependent RNA helicase n=1 Tax=Paenibacillus sp. 481 TaxID=2835869 RepID=UPI001E64DA80|nr:ATP-dependent helicase C-terminal domain-containing protein [Paenibacillus sp. 481]UHA76016.1 DEAD/DEAH box helicase [Paenibacillus sp. 481]